jgi:hypothetical protein
MKSVLMVALIVAFGPHAKAQQPQPPPAQPQAQPGAPQAPPAAAGAASQGGASPTLTPAQVGDLLRKVYNDAYRVTDLLTLLQPEKWQMDEAARKSFAQTLESLRVQLKQLEDWRKQFASQPQNLTLGNATDAAIGSVCLDTDAVARAVSQYRNPADAAQYKQAGEQLLNLERTLKAYLDSLRAATQAPPPAPAAPQKPPAANPSETGAPLAALPIEQVTAPPAAPPPATSTEVAGSITPQQIKTLMQQVYTATFRLEDLMTLVQPERWKVPEPVRESFHQEVATLRSRVRALDKLRSEFADHPDSSYLGYEVSTAIPPVVSDLGRIAQDVSQFEDRKLAAQVGQPGRWLKDAEHTLESYLDTMLSRNQEVVRSYLTDLATCQNTLNYAMRSRTPVEPMQPIKFARPLQSLRMERRKAAEAARAAAQAKADSKK